MRDSIRRLPMRSCPPHGQRWSVGLPPDCLERSQDRIMLVFFQIGLLATEYVGMVRELSALAAAKGIPLIDFGPFHIKTWCRGDVKEAIEKVLASSLASSQSTNSALQAIQKGQTTEFRACLGPLIEDARQHAIPMPREYRLLYSTLMGLEETLQ